MFDDVVVVFKALGDLQFYVTGDADENELILYAVLQGFYEAVSLLLRCACACVRSLLLHDAAWAHARARVWGVHAGPRTHTRARSQAHTHVCTHTRAHSGGVDKKAVLENLDLALLVMDEVVDAGCVRA